MKPIQNCLIFSHHALRQQLGILPRDQIIDDDVRRPKECLFRRKKMHTIARAARLNISVELRVIIGRRRWFYVPWPLNCIWTPSFPML